jgi:hypothetical protein
VPGLRLVPPHPQISAQAHSTRQCHEPDTTQRQPHDPATIWLRCACCLRRSTGMSWPRRIFSTILVCGC